MISVGAAWLPARSHCPLAMNRARDGFGGGNPRGCTAQSSEEESEIGIWDLGFGIWDLGFGIWDLGFGIWDLGFGIWDGCRAQRRAE